MSFERMCNDARSDVGPTGDTDGQFRLLVQNVLDYAIFMMDAEGRVTAWNEGATRLKGYTPEEVIGQHFSIFFTPEDRRIGKPEYEKNMAEAHGRHEGEGWRVRKDGTRFWGNEIITAIRDADGRVTGFTKIARNLTERKRMEDELREREERIRLMVESIRDYAVFVMDPDGRITSWNTGAERVFGYDEGEIVGRPGSLLFTPEDIQAGEHARELATALAEGRASDDRWQVRKGGVRFWASGVTHAIRDAEGALRGYAKVCRDLTEWKQVEAQRERLLEQEKLARLEAEQAMTMRDQFLAVVSHELRTPLTAILLWAKLMRTGAVKEREWARAVETIEHSAEAQRQLIEDLLDVSRITSGKLRLNVREADLAVVVRSAAEAVRPMAEARGVRLELDLDDRAGRVRADPDRVQQVVWNLLNNAVKFTDRGGRVDVRLERLDDHVRVRVTDTGRGIARGFLPHVFELFRQADAAMTRSHGGLGLGLSICKTLVELHGGTITASSAGLGHGSEFEVALPVAADEAVESGGTPPPAEPARESLRILVVDDNQDGAESLAALLQIRGFTVSTAFDGEQALAAAESFRPDLILLDIGLPKLNGYEVCRAIKARPWATDTRVIAITGWGDPKSRQAATEAGFDRHFVKPIANEQLLETIREMSAERR